MKIIAGFSFIAFFSFHTTISSQHRLYNINDGQEAVYISVGATLNIIGILLRNSNDRSTLAEINALNVNDISSFDRGATNNFSSTAQKLSDGLLYTGATLPFIMYFGKACRAQDASVALMGLETFLINNGLTNITKAVAKRYRPFVYNPEVVMI